MILEREFTMKKILIVTTVGGFVTQFEKNNLAILNELNYEIHYASNFSNNIYNINYDTLKAENVHIHELDMDKSVKNISSHIRNIKALIRIINEFKIDVVHCHTPVGSVLARMAAHKAERRPYVIYTAHGFHFYKGAPLGNKIYHPVERMMSRYTDCLVTINEEDYEAAKKFGTRRRKSLKVVKIPGVGLDTERFKPEKLIRNNVRQEYNISNDTFHMVTIGEINKNKNLTVVVRALAKINNPSIHYNIWGRGPGIDTLKKLIDDLNLQNQVHIMGYCENPEYVLQGADTFVFPSLREGLGMAALEAMACGVPVIAMDNRGTREYMQDGFNGFVCMNNSEDEFADNIRQMYDIFRNKPEKMRAFKENCRETGLRFQIASTGKIMRDVYGDIGK